MTHDDLQRILCRLPELRIVVVGDFFLDKYLVLDPRLAEVSLETGLQARQVVAKRQSPGAAGTVTSNLRALGVGTVLALGAIGDDGEGYDLRQGLQATGVDMSNLIITRDLFTPTYTKPMELQPDGSEREIERIDIKNRYPLSRDLEDEIIRRLNELALDAHAVVVSDQVQERNCGVITDRVREELARLAEKYDWVVLFADSRERIGEFRCVMVKPNRREAVRAVRPGFEGEATTELAAECGAELCRRTGRPVFVTCGDCGILVITKSGAELIPAVRVDGPIDIVGAGDAATAGIVCGLCAGANLRDAAVLGNLVASITVQQIGTTGTASPGQVMQRFADHADSLDR